MSEDIILEARGLCRDVGRAGERKRIVDDLSFQFERGNIYAILGPSGAGKSSFLRLLNRLDEPTDGDVVFEGRSYREYAPCELRRRVGYVFQMPFMFAGSVKDNLRQADESLSDDRLSELVQSVALSPELLARDSHTLSVGQQQRVAMARALATGPSVVLLDEPTASLDPTYTDKIERTIISLAENRGLTVIVVSHHPNQAVRLKAHGLLLVDGKLAETGSAKDIVENPQTEAGRRYRDKELG